MSEKDTSYMRRLVTSFSLLLEQKQEILTAYAEGMAAMVRWEYGMNVGSTSHAATPQPPAPGA